MGLESGNIAWNPRIVHVDLLGVRITGGPGTLNFPVFKVFGGVRVINQYAFIRSITTLANATDVHADTYDGTIATPLTKAIGCSLSAVSVDTMFSRMGDETEEYTVLDAATVGYADSPKDEVGSPFLVNKKYGADTFIRFNLTTSDAPVDFTMDVHFVWEILNGGYLELV